MSTLRRKFGHAAGRRGKFYGSGRIAGHTIAYVTWDNGDRISHYTLSQFRKAFGVSASKLKTGDVVVEREA